MRSENPYWGRTSELWVSHEFNAVSVRFSELELDVENEGF